MADVYITDINKEAANAVAAGITADGGKAETLICNVVNQEEVKAVFANLTHIDLLVNSAGISHIGTVETTSEEDFDKLYNVNVKGVYNCLHEAIPVMKQNGGAIVNLASIASNIGLPDRFAYSMTKGAVLGMTLSVAKDYLKHNIRCNCISPARVHTPFVDGVFAKKLSR